MARLFSISSSSFLASSIFYYKRTTSTHTRQLDTHMYDVFACGMMRFSNGNSFIQQNIRRKLSHTPFLFAIAIIPSIITEDVVSRRKSMPFHLIPTTTTFSATIWMFGSHAKSISYLRFGVCTPIPRRKIIFIVYTR